MSSRTLAAAKARRAGESAPPVSGNRPVTSIHSQAAFVQQMPPHMSYNMPPPPNNVRVARAMGPPPQNPSHSRQPNQQQYYQQQQQQQSYQQQQTENVPFSKLSVSDAIGLLSLRLGRVEQWIIDTDHENEENGHNETEGTTTTNVPNNHTIIDNSILNTLINRIDTLEKNPVSSLTTQELNDLREEFKQLKEQFTRMADDVNKHTIEIAKNTEQVFRFNRELTETKDILKSFMVKYDMFSSETAQNFADYETALSDLESRLPEKTADFETTETQDKNTGSVKETNEPDEDTNVILSYDLKNVIKEELSK